MFSGDSDYILLVSVSSFRSSTAECDTAFQTCFFGTLERLGKFRNKFSYHPVYVGLYTNRSSFFSSFKWYDALYSTADSPSMQS